MYSIELVDGIVTLDENIIMKIELFQNLIFENGQTIDFKTITFINKKIMYSSLLLRPNKYPVTYPRLRKSLGKNLPFHRSFVPFQRR